MVVLIVVSGPPGVGKSAVGDALAVLSPVVRLSIDDVEEALRGAGLPAEATGVAAYEAVRAAAEQNLALGRDVVVDAVNDSLPARETWSRAADSTGARLLQVVLALRNGDAHRRRLTGRMRPFVHVAEPSWADVRVVMARTAPWADEVLGLDAALPARDLAALVLARLRS